MKYDFFHISDYIVNIVTLADPRALSIEGLTRLAGEGSACFPDQPDRSPVPTDRQALQVYRHP